MSVAAANLLRTCPTWFALADQRGGDLLGVARVSGTPWSADGVALRIWGSPIAAVSEQVPGTCFPARCPERHVQYDRSFCLGLHRLCVEDVTVAAQWWEQLRQYIRCQAVAERTRIWPPAHALDHGGAGEYHEQALGIAAKLGIAEEYELARLGAPSWITDPRLRLLGRRGEPVNGRVPCPRGCRTRGRRNWPKVRRDCAWREDLLELVRYEQQRRAELQRYWELVRSEGTRCCGRMAQCELRTMEQADATA